MYAQSMIKLSCHLSAGFNLKSKILLVFHLHFPRYCEGSIMGSEQSTWASNEEAQLRSVTNSLNFNNETIDLKISESLQSGTPQIATKINNMFKEHLQFYHQTIRAEEFYNVWKNVIVCAILQGIGVFAWIAFVFLTHSNKKETHTHATKNSEKTKTQGLLTHIVKQKWEIPEFIVTNDIYKSCFMNDARWIKYNKDWKDKTLNDVSIKSYCSALFSIVVERQIDAENS